MTEYCPQCGCDRYIKGKSCPNCDFPKCYEKSEPLEIDLWQIDTDTFVNSNEYEDSKNED